MIILITGASHTGKTVLAQKLLEKYKYPYFSIDHLKMGLIRSGYTKLTPEDDAELEAYMWPIILGGGFLVRIQCIERSTGHLVHTFEVVSVPFVDGVSFGVV